MALLFTRKKNTTSISFARPKKRPTATALGTGWNPSSATQTIFATGCLGGTLSNPVAPTQISPTTTCAPHKTAITNGRPYNLAFPYFGYILQTQSGFISN